MIECGLRKYRLAKSNLAKLSSVVAIRRALTPRWHSSYASLYFHHVGKTGGTTVDTALRNWFGQSRSFPDHGVTSRLLREANRYTYFSGHMPWSVSELMPAPCLVLTTIRSPIQHFLSTYKHLARLGTDHIALSHRSRALASLDDYLDDTTLYHSTLNPQSFSIGRELNWQVFLRRCHKTHTVNWRRQNTMDSSHFYFLYGSKDDSRTSTSLLDRARARLGSANTLSFPTEMIDINLNWILSLVAGSEPTNIPSRLNASPVAQHIDIRSDQRAEIEQRTFLDKQLYSYCCSQYEKRVD